MSDSELKHPQTLLNLYGVKQDTIAVLSADSVLKYEEIFDQAPSVAKEKNPYFLIRGNRDMKDFVELASTWILNCPYIPLNPKFSEERTRAITSALEQISDDELTGLAYIIFTSGTTGEPKGVPIARSQLHSYANVLRALYAPTPDDRVIQIADLSFDLSVMELSLAWPNGAALCVVPSQHTLMAPRYAQDMGVTIWVSVPSVISMSHKAGLLKPNSLPDVRLALFCGEALTYHAIRAFSLAAPNARLVNTYGPTEATVSVTHFEIDRKLLVDEQPADPLLSVMPLGFPDPGVELGLFNPGANEMALGDGELCISSERVTSGYINNPDLNATKFFMYGGKRWYRTGDLAFYSDQYGYCYKGRTDRQIKLKGYRIELQDIESALRKAAKTDLVCVVPFPVLPDGSIQDLVGVVATSLPMILDVDSIKEGLADILPSYMVPAKVLSIAEMPLSINGKVDFKAVQEWVKERLS